MNLDLGTLWRAKFTLLIFTLAGLGGGLLYLRLTPTTYEAQARVLIEPQGLSPEDAPSGRVVPEFIPTQAETIRSPITIREAAKKTGITRPPGADEEKFDPIRHVLKSLVVTPVLNANVVTISYRSINETEATELIAEIVAAYRTFINEVDETNSGSHVQLLAAREEKLRTELRELETEYENLRKQNPMIGQGRVANVDALSELDLLGRQLAEVGGQRRELTGRLQAIFGRPNGTDGAPEMTAEDLTRIEFNANLRIDLESQANVRRNRVLKAALQQTPSSTDRDSIPPTDIPIDREKVEAIIRYSDPIDARELQTLEQNLRFAILQADKLDQVYGDRHRDLIAARAEADEYETLLRERLETTVRSWQKQLAILQAKEQELRKAYDQGHQLVKQTEVYQLREANLQRDIDNLQRLHGSTLEQLLTLQSADAAISQGRNSIDVRILDGPQIITDLTWPNPKLLLAGSLCVGFLIGFSVVALREFQWSESRAAEAGTEHPARPSGSAESARPEAARPANLPPVVSRTAHQMDEPRSA